MERRDHSIRKVPGAGHSRPAFTLAELVVSIGILVVLLAIAGEVMGLTVRSTGQAMALTKVNESFRILEQTLRKDLAGVVRPGPGVDESSLLLIQANPVNAYWEKNGKAVDNDADPGNGYPYAKDPQREVPDPGNPDQFIMSRPRADILMFFTRGEGRSMVNYSYTNGATTTPPLTGWKQVVYGHADLGEYIPPANPSSATPGFEFAPNAAAFEDFTDHNPVVVSPAPAQDWHLARRVVQLTADFENGATPDPWANIGLPGQSLDWEQILLGQTDIIGNVKDVPGGPQLSYKSLVVEPYLNDPNAARRGWPAILSNSEMRPFARSRIDQAPPPIYANRLGQYFINHCASFKVEWTLDPRSDFVGGRLDGERQVYWFDQGDLGDDPDDPLDDRPLRSLEDAEEAELAVDPGGTSRYWRLQQLLEDQLGGGPDFPYSLEERFGTPGPWIWYDHPYSGGSFRPNLVVFTAKRNLAAPGDPPNIVSEDIFPAALRITVDLNDDENRLGKPIRHVMVIPVGTQ